MAIKAEEEHQSSAVATQAEYTSDREYDGKSTCDLFILNVHAKTTFFFNSANLFMKISVCSFYDML